MINQNDPAFGHGDMDHCCGLSKREYIASLAMQGILTQEAYARSNDEGGNDIPKRAVEYADALIKELNK